MKFVFSSVTVALAILATGCGTSSTTVTGPSLDRCSITVANSMSSVDASGGTGRLTVTAGRECTWSVTSNVPWITITSDANGIGNGSVAFSVTANTGVARTGTITIAGLPFTVTQNAVLGGVR